MRLVVVEPSVFMNDWLSAIQLLAQEDAPGGRPEGGGLLMLLFPMLAIGFLWYFMVLRPQRREQARRDDLLGALKKNDRVVTIGGIIGTVANLSADNKEVTLKVDDNTRIRLLRSSIQTVLKDEEGGESAK